MPDIKVDQNKLVMNAFAATLQNNLVAADVVTWKEYDNELDDRNGLSVSEQVGPRYAVTETTDGVVDLTSTGTQGSVFGSEQFKVNKTFGSSMGWGDFQKIRDIGAARESEALANAATNLAEKIDAYVLKIAGLASNNWTGNPGEVVDDFDEFMSGYTRLKEEGVSDADLNGVLSFTDKQKLGNQIGKLSAPDSEATKAIRVGFKGDLGGIPTLFTQQLPSLTVGTRAASGAAQANGANQNVNYKDVAVSSAPGRYMSQTVSVKNMTSGHTIKAGEVFTWAGVFAYDNRKGGPVSPDRLQQFTVLDDATADGSGLIAALRIFPAIIVPGSGSGNDVNINTAHATVTAAPANSAPMTFLGTASTAYTPRMIIQKSAVVVNTAPLIMPATGESARRKLSKIPLSVRMWKHSDFKTGEHGVRFDVALTANVRDRRRIVRVNGG